MRWTKLIVSVDPMAVEAVANMMMELGVEGIEIEDNILTDADKEAMFVNYVDDKIVPCKEHRIIAYLDETKDVEEISDATRIGLRSIAKFLDVGTAAIEVEVMPDEDYENKWKEFYSSFRVGDRIVVTPIWEEVETTDDDILIKIDPGMAFGSGTHETTSLCIEFLEKIECKNKSIVDVGCGSGILGIAAAKLGAIEVVGIDIDERAVTIAKENVNSNEVSSVMKVFEGNLMDQITKKVDLVVANILADVIILIASDVKAILKEDGSFIASGIILDKIDDTISALEGAGFSSIEKKIKGEWAAIIAK